MWYGCNRAAVRASPDQSEQPATTEVGTAQDDQPAGDPGSPIGSTTPTERTFQDEYTSFLTITVSTPAHLPY
jgi:hypothetical protein